MERPGFAPGLLFDLGAGGGEVYGVRETSHVERTISRYWQVDEQAAGAMQSKPANAAPSRL